MHSQVSANYTSFITRIYIVVVKYSSNERRKWMQYVHKLNCSAVYDGLSFFCLVLFSVERHSECQCQSQ